MPAPVNGTITLAPAIMSPSCSTPLRRSGAIMQGFAPADGQRCSSSQLCKAGRPFAIPQGVPGCYLPRPRFFAGFAIRKSSFFLPALISRASHPAVPPLPLHVSPVFGCRYFGATLLPFIEPALRGAALSPPISASCACNSDFFDCSSRSISLRIASSCGPERFFILVDGIIFPGGVRPFGVIKPFAALLQHLLVEYSRRLRLPKHDAAICARPAMVH